MPKSAASALSAEPNVTPMIDVLLVLLIIFMAAIPAARQSLDAQLPPQQPSSEIAPVAIVLEVTADGKYAVNQQAVAPTELGSFLRRLYAGRPDKTIIVRGARAASYQAVITAMDLARGAGVAVIGVDTRQR